MRQCRPVQVFQAALLKHFHWVLEKFKISAFILIGQERADRSVGSEREFHMRWAEVDSNPGLWHESCQISYISLPVEKCLECCYLFY